MYRTLPKKRTDKHSLKRLARKRKQKQKKESPDRGRSPQCSFSLWSHGQLDKKKPRVPQQECLKGSHFLFSMKLWSAWMEAGSKAFSCLGRGKGGAAMRLDGGGHCKVGWRAAPDLPDSALGCFLYRLRGSKWNHPHFRGAQRNIMLFLVNHILSAFPIPSGNMCVSVPDLREGEKQ